MARTIRWSEGVLLDLLQILEFWKINNGSNTYSKKLLANIMSTVGLLSEFPELGKATQLDNVRAIIFTNYRIVYEIHKEVIEVLVLRDDRMDPNKLKV